MIKAEALPTIQCGTLHFPGGFCFIKESQSFILTNYGNTAIVGGDVLENLQNGVVPSESRPYFLQRGILEPTQLFSRKKAVSYFIIDLAKNCNFDCIYCFIDVKATR